jgi:thioredoxin 1
VSKAIELTETGFAELVAPGGGVALVDFWAEWCGPCRMMAPAVEELAESYEGRAAVRKLDVDAYGALAANYGVMNIPTLLLFKDGQEVKRFVGVQSKAALQAALDELL